MATDAASLLLLLNWMSPAFPIGAFAYSHGLEQVIADGGTANREQLRGWVAEVITRGSGWCEAVVFARCWHDDAADLNRLALALAGSAERHLETTQLGRAFAIAAGVWTDAPPPAGDQAYPVAAGTACAALAIPQRAATLAFVQGFCAALVSVAVRLVPLGQTEGLRVLRDLAPLIADVAARAETAELDDLASATFAADIAAMRHETLQPRIFRT